MLIVRDKSFGTYCNFISTPCYNSAVINQVSTTKSFCVLIRENLTRKSHNDKLGEQIASGIAAIKRKRQFVSLST